MRLESFSVQKFRSIIKAEKLALSDLTVLVGPNNEGKSNILQALVMGMEELSSPTASTSRRGVRAGTRLTGDYSWERDFPQSLKDSEPNGRSSLDFDFSLTDEEINAFHAAVGSRLNGNLPIRLQFGGARPTFSVRKQRHSAALSAKRAEIAEFVAERVQVLYIPAVRNADVVADVVRSMVRRGLYAVESEPEYQDALAKLRAVQQPVLDRLAAGLTAKMRELLPDVASVEFETDDRRANVLGQVRLIVDDGTRTDLELKGDGVQSLAALSAIQHYSTQQARAKEFILAVEEPEAHLHPRAIHALRSVLKETALKQQVVVTTHSPLFVNRLHVGSNVIVERTRARPAESVQELRDVLGVRTSDNLEYAEVILAVEGPEDEQALRSLLADASPELRQALADGTVMCRPLFGSGKLTYVLAELRDSLASVHAFLDGDEAGSTAARAAQNEGLLDPPDQTLIVLPGASESEFEDMIEPATYEIAFWAEWGVKVDHPWMSQLGKGKWSKRLPAVVKASGKLWNEADLPGYKATVSKAVASTPGSSLKRSAQPIFDALVQALEEKLRAR